uniref:DUF2599 domain-containing protein n=1 Tax=Pseudomonas sp. TaxID=306 RepID=UPI00262B2FC9
LCSGLMLRGTQHSDNYRVWNPSPTSVANQGVSFSYLRHDARYDRLGLINYNGYALKPADSVSAPEEKLKVVCFFPLDAWTDTRDQNGCGDNSTTAAKESQCKEISVRTAEDWIKDYNRVKKERPEICSFDVTEEKKAEAVRAFNEGLRAMQLLKEESFSRQDEIRVVTWDQDKPEQLPILAFIYTRGLGLKGAQADQKDLYNATGKWVPVINLDLPDTLKDEATFTYKIADQAVNEPSSSCGPYIQSAVWRRADVEGFDNQIDQLSVTPTSCGRNMTAKQTDAAFAELSNKYRDQAKWSPESDNSMRRQFLCLRLMYSDNPTWNIEPFRPYVSAEQAKATKCNPRP